MGCATSAISKEPLSSSDDRREPGDRRQFDVVVGGAAQAKSFAADVAAGQFGQLAVIHAHVPVDVIHSGAVRLERADPVACEGLAPLGNRFHARGKAMLF
jgi:hypothetical protein